MTSAVVDASVLVDMLTTGRGLDLLTGEVHAPSHVRLEAGSALRALQRKDVMSRQQANTAFADLATIPLRAWDLDWLLPAAWNTREEITLYDGLYVALASALDLPLATLDLRLRSSAGRHCRVLQEW